MVCSAGVPSASETSATALALRASFGLRSFLGLGSFLALGSLGLRSAFSFGSRGPRLSENSFL